MSIRSDHNVAVCTSCGIRLAKPYWWDGEPYCFVDYEIQVDYDNASIIERGYREFKKLIRLFTT